MTEIAALTEAVNNTWILTVSFLIFFMHAGFAMLEAGQVRSKNVANQLTKNMLTWAVGVTVFFGIGAGFTALMSGGSFMSGTMIGSGGDYISWFYGAVFAMTAATIVSGAVAGRAKLRAYVTYTFLLAAVIYPMVIAFTWSAGSYPLTAAGELAVAADAPVATGLVERITGTAFKDFAGGTIVHALGGIAGLTAAAILGPRMDRYDDTGSLQVIPGHSMTFAVLGTLMLCFGWYGFNVGTAGATATGNLTQAVMTTTIAMAMGAIGAAGVAYLKSGKVDTLYTANGMLAGLAGITAIPDVATWWGAIVVGILAGAQLPYVFEYVSENLKIDDVCAVFPVHGSAGVLGTLLYPFVSTGVESVGSAFIAQVVGVVIIGGWAITATGIIWYALKAAGEARVTPDHEQDGLDIAEHGVETYPEFGGDRVATDGFGPTEDEEIKTDGGENQEIRTDGGRELRTDGGDPELKMIMSIIRPEKLGDVKKALAEVGAPSLTVTNVSGRGSQPAKKGSWRGEEYTVDLHQKVKIECIVADVSADETAEAIKEAANTGEPGDGKIFVLDVDDAIQVRTGKEGTEAV